MSGGEPKLAIRGLSAWFDDRAVLEDIDIDIQADGVTAIVGPSGSGKSTFIRCINRLHELAPGARVSGSIRLDGRDILDPRVNPIAVRRRIGMVFREPNPFTTMSIRGNVLAGLHLNGERPRGRKADDLVEGALREVGLWGELRDHLDDRASTLPLGQQQRLCIARAVAVEPEVLLMDEPCSVLNPTASAKIEDLLHSLQERYTVLIVTHNLQQAARVSDRVAFFLAGQLVEYASSDEIFTAARDKRTEDYITGKFG